jgi:hypothetical protein
MSSTGSGDTGSTDAIGDKIKQLIKENKVMVFSATYCKS